MGMGGGSINRGFLESMMEKGKAKNGKKGKGTKAPKDGKMKGKKCPPKGY